MWQSFNIPQGQALEPSYSKDRPCPGHRAEGTRGPCLEAASLLLDPGARTKVLSSSTAGHLGVGQEPGSCARQTHRECQENGEKQGEEKQGGAPSHVPDFAVPDSSSSAVGLCEIPVCPSHEGTAWLEHKCCSLSPGRTAPARPPGLRGPSLQRGFPEDLGRGYRVPGDVGVCMTSSLL